MSVLPPPSLPFLQPDRPEWDEVCRACGVCRTARSYQIWGEGNPASPIVLLGEAPGEEEDDRGAVFQGRAGWVLNRALHEAGLQRAELFIANVLKCRPINQAGKNRPPTVEELTACRTWLDEELAVLPNKRVIVAMGASALWSVLAPHVPAGGVFELQGRTFWSERYQLPVVATVHPGLILRKPGEAVWLPLDFKKAVEIAAHGRLPTVREPRFTTVRTLEQLGAMMTAFRRARVANPQLMMAFDWETAPNLRTWGDALHPTQAIGFCLSVSWEAHHAYIIPRFGAGLMPLWHRHELPLVDAALVELFLSDVMKIGHHVAFDINVTRSTLHVVPVNVRGCTMIANHTCDNHLSERAHGLKRMADIFTDYGRYDDELDQWLVEHGYTRDGKPDGGAIWKAPNALIWKYASVDSMAPWLIHPQLERRLRAAGQWNVYQERVQLAIEYADMDRRGVPVSRAALEGLSTDLATAMESVKAEIGSMVLTWKCAVHGRVFLQKCCEKAKGGAVKEGSPGEPLNPNSGPQVAAYLYEFQGLPITHRTETGQPSTKEDVLRQYEEVEPLVPPILHFRAYTKLKSTYVDGKLGQGGILASVDPDGVIHPSTLLTVVETLRLATRKPFPVHLIPRPLPVWECLAHGKYRLSDCCPGLTTKGVLNIRGMVRPRSDAEVLLAGDYEQQEYVLAAIASGQADMEAACLDRGEDAHAYVMQALSGRSKREFQAADGTWLSAAAEADYGNLRSRFKSINFMVLYLGGPAHLAHSLKETEDEAARQIEEYYVRLPKIREWQTGIIKRLHETGRVEGLFGVGRALPNVYSPYRGDRNEAERQACNFPFQNGGAHVMFRGLLRIAARWRKERFPGRVVFSVHDEIVSIVRRTHALEGMAMLQEEMERPCPELVGGCGIPRGVRASVKALAEWGGPALPQSALY